MSLKVIEMVCCLLVRLLCCPTRNRKKGMYVFTAGYYFCIHGGINKKLMFALGQWYLFHCSCIAFMFQESNYVRAIDCAINAQMYKVQLKK